MAVPDALLIVEGPHDAEFVARLLKAAGYQDRVKEIRELPNDSVIRAHPRNPRF